MTVKHLESKQNATIKYLFKLKSKKGRTQHQTYIIDGLRIVDHALSETDYVEFLFISNDFYQSEMMQQFEHIPVDIFVLTDDLFESIVETETPQGIAAVVKMHHKKLGGPHLLFLDEIQDPGNLGTLIRTADAAGFSGVILKKGCTDPYGQKALRSSMGSVMSIPIIMNADGDLLKKLEGYSLYGAALEGGKSYKTYQYQTPFVLVIGNEANGISKEVLDLCEYKVFIPMFGAVESLNASIAGGILMFEMKHACTT